MGGLNLKLILGVVLVFLLVNLGLVIIIQKLKNKVELSLENKIMENVRKVSFYTDDEVKIVGHYYEGNKNDFAFILVHMRPATKESYQKFARFFQEKGYTSLAIDLRGHGESVESAKGILNYEKMLPEEEQASILDLEAASKFLYKESGGVFTKEKQVIVGASIGANLAFQFLHDHPEVPAVVLLSPGLNYRGIVLEKYKDGINGEKIMAVFAKDDLEEAIKAYNTFKEWFPSSTLLMYDKGRHGTDILEANPELLNKIYFWLMERLASK